MLPVPQAFTVWLMEMALKLVKQDITVHQALESKISTLAALDIIMIKQVVHSNKVACAVD